MPLFRRTPAAVDPRVVLELTSRPDGSGAGRIDDTPVELGRGLELIVPVGGIWPGEVVSLAVPRPLPPLGPSLQNRARRAEWMAKALRQPELSGHLEALARGPMAVEVAEDALTLRWLEGADGPFIRRTAREAAALARLLPKAMHRVVGERTRTEADYRRSLLPRPSLPGPSPQAAVDPKVGLQLRRRLRWRLGILLASIPLAMLLPALVLGGAGIERFVVFGSLWVGVSWVTLLFRCPRCHGYLHPWFARGISALFVRSCRHCGLTPD